LTEKSEAPLVSAAASWMDSFKMPIREIHKKYTKSELIMLAWDSRQKAYAMSQMYKRPAQTTDAHYPSEKYVNTNGIHETKDAYEMPKTINEGVPIPKSFINKEGEIDLRQATGPQAVRYLRALGINIATKF